MPVTGWDHVSFPARDPEAILDFYKRLGFETIHEEEFRSGRYPVFAIAIGENAKLNFHGPAFWQDPNFDARGPTALPGCGDFCFVFKGTIEEAVELDREGGGEDRLRTVRPARRYTIRRRISSSPKGESWPPPKSHRRRPCSCVPTGRRRSPDRGGIRPI